MVADATKCHPLFCSQKRHTKKETIVADATKCHTLFCSQKRHTKKNMMVADATKCHPDATKCHTLFCSQKRHKKKEKIDSGGCNEMSYPLVQSEKTYKEGHDGGGCG